jgi:hypothetical protein
MRIPSLDNLHSAARDSLARFPFVMLSAAVAAIAGIFLVESSNNFEWMRVCLAGQLGIPLVFALAVAGESRGWPRPWRILAPSAATIALAIYGFSLSEDLTTVMVTRHVQFTIGLHLLAAFAAFTAPGRLNGFWQYNRTLFLRFCLSVLYSVVLYAGLAIALLAVDKLLGVEFDEELYFHVWIVIAMVFNTWMFVSGVPADILALDGATDFPKGLKVFAQFILVPLVFIYLVILSIYLGKVIVTRVWPSGWIGYLVSSVGVVGMLAHLLVHPIREGAGNKWVITYSRWYYVAMLPAIVMLLLAIGKRINQYGVTENRYLLAVLAIWLALISLYFILSRARNIKLIPITLCVVAFGTSFGPWGAFAVSYRSQMSRLTGLLEKNHILAGGIVQPAPGEVSFEDQKEISAALDYVVTTHGTDRVAPWFGDHWADIDTVSGGGTHRRAPFGGNDLVRGIMDEMGVEYTPKWHQPVSEGEHFTVGLDTNAKVFPLEGADAMVRFEAPAAPIEIGDPNRTVSWDDVNQAMVFAVGDYTLVLDMEPWIRDVVQRVGGTPGYGTMSSEQAKLAASNDRLSVIVYVDNVSGKVDDDGSVVIHHVSGMCFMRWLE